MASNLKIYNSSFFVRSIACIRTRLNVIAKNLRVVRSTKNLIDGSSWYNVSNAKNGSTNTVKWFQSLRSKKWENFLAETARSGTRFWFQKCWTRKISLRKLNGCSHRAKKALLFNKFWYLVTWLSNKSKNIFNYTINLLIPKILTPRIIITNF